MNKNLSKHSSFFESLHMSVLHRKESARRNFNKFTKDMSKKMGLLKKNMTQDTLVLSSQNLGLLKLNREMWRERKKTFNDHCQLLRSASEWSIGLEENFVERSIQNAYLDLIENAKSHIYIENQFFISSDSYEDPDECFVKNEITKAMFKRIKRAIDEKQKFKITIVMPLLPGQEGEVGENITLSLKLIMHWQYNTICRGSSSLL